MKIGLRIPGTARQLPFADFCKWCADNGLMPLILEKLRPKLSKPRGMPVLLSAPRTSQAPETCSARKNLNRKPVPRQQKPLIEAAADNDVHIMFCVFVPEDASLGRAKNFDI